MKGKLDLYTLMGAPEMVCCPRCKELVDSGCKSYDMGLFPRSNPERGYWELTHVCSACGWTWVSKYQVHCQPFSPKLPMQRA